jgi:hypothetical protein
MRIRTLALAAASILIGATGAAPLAVAQQAPGAPLIKQEVPDNPSDPTPPDQPIPYSHKLHLSIGLTCANCHKNPEPGNLMTFPATSICMGCHVNVLKNKAPIEKLAAYAKSGEAIPWVRVYRVTVGVNWSHRKHLDAGMKCEMCHGQVREMDRMYEKTSVTTMAVCLNCHQAHNAPTACQTCHSWPPANLN